MINLTQFGSLYLGIMSDICFMCALFGALYFSLVFTINLVYFLDLVCNVLV